jgi:uncharacterized radical SAM protein YgiQ
MNSDKHFLPITRKEIEALGWAQPDVILITGDAYVDHPSFGAAVIGRILEREGLRVAIIPQPNWRDDLRDFSKMGKPRLFFGITGGNMDSMVNHYTASRRLRANDAYTPGGVAGFRPDYALVTYSRIVKRLYPDVPVVLGGIEASMRRLSHYDYWSNRLRPSVLVESHADWLVYGMGEKPIVAIARCLQNQDTEALKQCPQVAYFEQQKNGFQPSDNDIMLHPYEAELKDKQLYGENFMTFETEANKKCSKRLVQPCAGGIVTVNPPFPPATEAEMDSYALFAQMMNAPHPKYAKRGDIPAFEMIKNSITIHRGCFGGCSFCTIAAHQGKFISSRSEASVLAEVANLSRRDYFKGHISDLGGPSANMYRMGGIDELRCQQCSRPSCIFPKICSNLNCNHAPLLALYRKALQQRRVKLITIGSGIRYDMLLNDDKATDEALHLTEYLEEVAVCHVSGRLKVAPEHTDTQVLALMRKPAFAQFLKFVAKFRAAGKKFGRQQQLIPYFISSHPGCTVENMAELAIETRLERLATDQVQDFTPTPMTYATAMYYLGYDPYSGVKLKTASTYRAKKEQNSFFFWYKKENRPLIKNALLRIGRSDLIKKLYD